MTPANNRLESHYQQEDVAKSYIDERFSKPLGRVQHKSQVDIINRVIADYDVKNVLEIACGPARLTAEVMGFKKGIALDRSDAMLEVAQKRTPASLPWVFIAGSAFNLELEPIINLVYTLRFIRHLKRDERGNVYRQVRNVLAPDGLFLFDAICRDKPQSLKSHEAGGDIIVYDKVYKNEEELRQELAAAGFNLICLFPCVQHFYTQAFLSRLTHICNLDQLGVRVIEWLENIRIGTSLEWLVLCQKK